MILVEFFNWMGPVSHLDAYVWFTYTNPGVLLLTSSLTIAFTGLGLACLQLFRVGQTIAWLADYNFSEGSA